MRTALIVLLLGLAGPALALGSGEAKRAVTDDKMLENFGISPAGTYRAYCSAAVVETQDVEYFEDPPEFLPAVCVLTPSKFYVLSVESGQFIEELQIKIADIDGAALDEAYLRGRVQVIDGPRIALLNVWGVMTHGSGNARALHGAFLKAGVPNGALIPRFSMLAGWWD